MNTYHEFETTLDLCECGNWDIKVEYTAVNNDSHKALFQEPNMRWNIDVDLDDITMLNRVDERKNNLNGINEELAGYMVDEFLIARLMLEAKESYIKELTDTYIAYEVAQMSFKKLEEAATYLIVTAAFVALALI